MLIFSLLEFIVKLIDAIREIKIRNKVVQEINKESDKQVKSFEAIEKESRSLTRAELIDRLRNLRSNK